MTWYAKPSGGYTIESEEGKANAFAMRDILVNEYNFTLEAVAGVLGNCKAEGGYNPWRWESDIYPPTGNDKGCGLFGFTPYSRYLQTTNEMNLSVTQQTPNARPEVGSQQTRLMASGGWDWISYCWRPSWDINVYQDYYLQRLRILDQYGNGERLTLEQFARIDNVSDATFAFLACFEGPRVPNYETRLAEAEIAYDIIKEEPPIYRLHKMPLYMFLRRF